jgi:hypothetical protein
MQARRMFGSRRLQGTTRDRPAPASNSRPLSPKRVHPYVRELPSQPTLVIQLAP